MNLKSFYRYVFVFLLSVFVFTGCGSDNGGGVFLASDDNASGGGSSQKTTITGYAEDDPMPNATIKVTDSSNNVIAQATADANGKYSLEANFEEGKTYTLESKGKLGDRNITLHSIFKFSSDTVINANPLTELKYQLVQSGKSIDEAEALVRDYFSVVSGDKLERNRFDVGGSLALGMVDLAKLYDGTLPVDAIGKIKEDILRNDALAVEDREYSFRDLLKLKLELTASKSSLKVGENVTVSLLGADNLNSKYTIEWVGVPNDNNESTLSKTFTMQEAGDIFVSVNLYLKDDANSSNNILVDTQSVKVNFYKVEEPHNIDINGSDINVSIGSDVKLNIPANALSAGQQISYSEVTTNSSDYLKVFNLEPSGTTFSTPMEIRIKYDPSQVYDPRLLTIKRVSADGKEDILKVKEIDYANSELIFETEHFSKFWVEEHWVVKARFLKYGSVGWYQDASLEKWEEHGDSGYNQTIKDKYGIEVKKNSPFDYLVSSLDLYCNKNGISSEKCTKWLIYFNNKDNADKIKLSYQKFFNRGNNYDNFTNDYFNWYIINKLPPFPGDEDSKKMGNFAGKVLSVNNTNEYGVGIAFRDVYTLMNERSLEGGRKRDTKFLSYLNGASQLASAYNTKGAEILKKINEYAHLVSDLYKDIDTKADYQNNIIILKTIGGFIVEKLLGNVPLGDNYSYLLKQSFNMLEVSMTLHFVNAFGDNLPYSDFNEYFRNAISNASSTNFSVKNNNGILNIYRDNILISNEKSLYFLNKIFVSTTDIDENKANSYLANIYLTLKNYAKIKNPIDAKYRNELKKFTTLRGSRVAFEILKYEGEVKANDLISKRQASINGILKLQEIRNNRTQKRSFQKSKTAGSKIVTIPVLDSFDNFLEQIKINIPESKWDNITVKKVSLNIDSYSFDKESSTDTTTMTFTLNSFDGTSLFSQSNIDKSGFTLANEKYSQNLASIFANTNLDSSDYQDKFVVVKASILVNINGVDKVVSKEYQFINYVDSDNELITEPKYGKLTSAIRDAVSGEPIADARVTLLPIDITNNTDESGDYSFSKLPPNTYNVRVAKEGYKTVTIYDVPLADGEVKNIEVLLAIDDAHAENNGTATITLKDALNGNVVTGGYVKVREGQNNKVGDVVKEITNGGSSINLNLTPNTYTVEVGANGYTHSFNTVTILGDVNGTYEFSITPVLSANQVRVVLSWGENPNDLDSHLVRTTNGNQDYHVYYSNMHPSNADANLDTDDTSSYGPETVTINNLSSASTYKYYVHDFSNGGNHSDEIFKTSGAKVDVYYGDQSRTFYIPNENGNAWKVFEIVNGEIVPCTTGCMFGVDGSGDANIGLRKLDRSSLDKRYFRNLPSK